MRPTSSFTTCAIAVLFALSASVAHADEWSGHLAGLVGLKMLDDNDWPELDTHFALGFTSDIQKDSWPFSLALDLMDTGEKHDHDGTEDLGHTTELHLGVRKVFTNQHSKLHPYINGGIALMYAEQEYEVENMKTKDDDSAAGGWFGVGAYYAFHPRYVLGLDVRYSRGEVSLFEQDRDAGGFHAYITAGIQF